MPIDDPQQQRGLAAELARELAPAHELFGVPASAIARRLDQDDVLFALTDGTGRVAEVHLTWKANDQPPWPHAIIFATLEHWRKTRLKGEDQCSTFS
jgi:hypothetical protein